MKFIRSFIVVLICIMAPSMVQAADKLSVQDAHKLAQTGEILLVDIRTPQEWRETKVGASAQTISMHSAEFLRNLESAIEGDKTKPIALICATGGRSQWLQAQLLRRGYTKIYDVSEGVLGSSAGPGWLKASLPLKDAPKP
ncbi:MAG: rhodanese-like domain-containing protein [Hyphomicrobiales bacterium]